MMWKESFIALLALAGCLPTALGEWGKTDPGMEPIPEIMWEVTGGGLTLGELKKKADGGDAKSKAQLANRMWATLHLELDEDMMFRLFSEAAAAGEPLGESGLAFCYSDGIGCKADGALTFKHAKRSADMGCAYGISTLSECYGSGYGCEKDREMEMSLLERCAADDPWAARILAKRWLRMDTKREDGERLLLELLEKDFPGAMYEIFRNGLGGRDKEQRFELLGRAARMGFRPALHSYALELFKRGRDLEGVEWLMESCSRRNVKSLGYAADQMMYAIRENDKADIHLVVSPQACFRMYDLSCRGLFKYPYYMNRFAFMLKEGLGGERDDKRAVEVALEAWDAYDRIGASNNNIMALSCAQILSSVSPPLRDLDRALAYAIYSNRRYLQTTELVAQFCAMDGPGQPNDPVRGWATILTAGKLKMESSRLKAARKKLEPKITPEIRVKAEVLSGEGFPHALKFRKEAAAFLGRPEPVGEIGED